MEIRCGKCNKLFRVADEKITDNGVKFSCTKCGDTVKITKEEFYNYTLSKTAVSALDMFESKPKSSAASMLGPDKAIAGPAPSRDDMAAHAPISSSNDLDQSSSSLPDFLLEKEEPVFSEPSPFEKLPLGEAPQPEQEIRQEGEPFFAIPVPPDEEQETGALIELDKKTEQYPELSTEPRLEQAAEPSVEQAVEPVVEPVKEPASQQTIPAEPVQRQDLENKMMPAADLGPMPKTEPKPRPTPEEPTISSHIAETQPAIQPKPSQAQPVVPEPMPEKEHVEQTLQEVLQAESSHSGRMVLVLLSVFILLGAVGYGVYRFMLPSMQNADRSAVVMTSTEGLRVVNPSGSLEPNGDLLITGSVENLTDQERAGWYVVVDVYDANGKILNKLRLLNGKQIYSSADYDILSKRGVNVPELKAKTLQSQGVVIPAKGSVSFEMRYFEPPVGIASFNATLQPFDPIRLFKEIEKTTK
jgi:predicted Zn finger-like uncharacterized protein